MNEISLMKELDSPYLLKLHEVYETPGTIYMVLDLMSGGELLSHLRSNGKYAESNCLLIMYKLLKAVEHMHSLGIIHRDLKPANILLIDKEVNPDIRVAGFSLATHLKTKNIIYRRCGTPGYCAPEVLESSASSVYDEKCDLFSVGCILFHL